MCYILETCIIEVGDILCLPIIETRVIMFVSVLETYYYVLKHMCVF